MIPDLNALAADAESDLGQHGRAREAIERRRAYGALRERLLPRAGGVDRCVGNSRHDLDRAAVPGGSDRRGVATLAQIPTLMVFGDHLGRRGGRFVNWQTADDTCQRSSTRCEAAGGDAEMMHLPKLGHERQQPHADAGQEQRPDRRPRDRVDRRARRAELGAAAQNSSAARARPHHGTLELLVRRRLMRFRAVQAASRSRLVSQTTPPHPPTE